MAEERLYGTIGKELDALRDEGRFRTLPECGFAGGMVVNDGRTLLNLSSNDYLGIASDGVLLQDFFRNLQENPGCPERLLSSTSSRLLTGNRPPYGKLEALLADYYGREAALVFNSGYHMNTGILPALTDSRSLILADKLVHASIIDGIRLSAARCIRYRHNDYARLEGLVQKYSSEYSRIFIVTESVFSMDGDLADLPRLVEIKRCNKNVLLYVDEAHAIGVLGGNGLGLAELTGTVGEIDMLCGTFGKAVASMGGFVVCDRLVRDYLVNRMRTLIFTTALPPVNIAWTLFVMERIPGMKEKREHLAAISEKLRQAVSAGGHATPSRSHIVPMVLGENRAAEEAALQMCSSGFYVLPIRPPTVPEGSARLRFSLTASVSDGDVLRLCDAVKDYNRRLNDGK